MYIYSKKSRRRMHAIPAAIALVLVILLWSLSSVHKAAAEPDNAATAAGSCDR